MSRVSTYLNFVGQTEEAFGFYGSVFGTELSSPIFRMGDAPPPPGAPELSDEQVRLISRVANLGERMILIVDAPELLDRRELGLLRQMAGAGPVPASS